MAGREASGRRPDHYAVLGVEPSSSAGQITSAYRRLVRALHPDANPDGPAADRRFADVVAAYGTLHDPALRAAYDAQIGVSGPKRAPSHGGRVGVDPLLWAGPTRVDPPSDGPSTGGPSTPWPHLPDLLWKWSSGWSAW
ncbi:J domain-containing protein [Streptomyces spiramyceticus]|uniref:J domain-containing protein n=1 Tax=Streptomyces spiramyceticus TaxID=299717 RepID=UPI00237BC2C6|nr:J domain-containing protein [Streptomyces spiramyceticus]